MSEENKAPQMEPETPAPEQTPETAPAEAETGSAAGETGEKGKEGKEKNKDKKKRFGETEVLKAKLEEAEAKVRAAEDRLLRTAAEFDNFRKRTAVEKDARFNDGVSFAVTHILDILDTLEMAAAAPCTDEAYKKGVEMTLDKAAKAFEKLGIQEIEALGAPFDPNLHAAVSQKPAEEGQESGQVVQVYQKGYKLGDKIVRHAAVVVAE